MARHAHLCWSRKSILAAVAVLYVVIIPLLTNILLVLDDDTDRIASFTKDCIDDDNDDKNNNNNNIKVALLNYTNGSDRRSLLIKCGNLHLVKLGHKISHGTTKQVYSAIFSKGAEHRKIVVKMVTLQSPDVSRCITAVRSNSIKYYNQGEPSDIPKLILYGNPQTASRNFYPSLLEPKRRPFLPEVECYVISNRKLMKEILLSLQLHHSGIVDFLGYCVRGETDYSTSLDRHSTIAAYEFCFPLNVESHLSSLTAPQKLNTAWMLADLLEYLHLSPLGSFRIADFKEAHFVISSYDEHPVDGLPCHKAETKKIQLIDLDDLESDEPRCSALKGHADRSTCGYKLTCVDGRCKGFNYLYNMDRMNHLFFAKLLQNSEMIRNQEEIDSKTGLEVTRSSIVEGIDKKYAPQLSKKWTYNSINFRSTATEYFLSMAKIREKLDKIEFSPSRLKNELVELCRSHDRLKNLREER